MIESKRHTDPKQYVHDRLVALGKGRVHKAQVIGDSTIPGALLLSLGLRESGLQNINNKEGTDRGCFQISEVYHAPWLLAHPGCKIGSWRIHKGRTALDPKHCPQFPAACTKAHSMLKDGFRRARRQELNKDEALRVAVAAYNAGFTGAMTGFQEEGDPDVHTTGKDYSEWVFEHWVLVATFLEDYPNWKAA